MKVIVSGLLGAVILAGTAPPGAATMLPQLVTDQDYREDGTPDPAKVELGRVLMFDKILSGNKNISCATCHHPFAATSDGLSLPVGEGGRGLSTARDLGVFSIPAFERVPRNSPALFNLGAHEFSIMFHDGRVEVDPTQLSGFISPAGDRLPPGLDSVLAAQAMFPVTSATEMAGQAGENPIADAAARDDLEGIWDRLARRLRRIPAYVELFKDAFPDQITSRSDITYVHAANAIAAFEEAAWRADDSPFDRFLRGDRRAMSDSAERGMRLFYGSAGCSGCHAGKFQTDQRFHAIAMPQIGPGKGDGMTAREDFGRGRETGDPADDYKFRTPSLRNVVLTGPWGHSGAYASLDAVMRHHLDPVASLFAYNPSQAVLPSRDDLDAIDLELIETDPAAIQAIADTNELMPMTLSDKSLEDIIAFLHALTDFGSLDLRHDLPPVVPSGLTIAD